MVTSRDFFSVPRGLVYPKELEPYFLDILRKIEEAYEIASLARLKGYDPTTSVEVKIASDLASRVEAMVGPIGVSKRIRELLHRNKEIEEIAFIIAREIAEGKYGIEDIEKRADQAIKTATAILTGGITAAPLEGVTHVKVRPNGHLAVYYAGPIRSAGGTETALTVVVADVVRQALGLQKYRASRLEIERFIEEVVLYNRYSSLQYPVSIEKLRYVLENIPIEITGEGTLDVEVSGPYRNLPNIETNRVRGGAILVLNDGLVAKAKKVIKIVKKLGISGWDWLERVYSSNESLPNTELSTTNSEESVKPDYTYLSEVIAGRPVFSSPSAIGGFRLRYGRSRNTGLAAVGVHPVTMYILDQFLAIGTQIKTERPGKGAIVMPVDSILPPLVKLNDGSVLFIDSVEKAIELSDKIDKILFLGDILIGVGEFIENNHKILPSPITEEWWVQEVRGKVNEDKVVLDEIITKASRDSNFAIVLSTRLKVPLHPRWTYFWRNIIDEELLYLKNKILESAENNTIERDEKIKIILEKLHIPHRVNSDEILLEENDFNVLKFILKKIPQDYKPSGKDALSVLNQFMEFEILDKYPVFIGVRMGRPEKAKQRMMKPPVHVLFPIGKAGYRSRSIIRIANNRIKSEVEAVNKYCPKCGIYTYENKCPRCKRRTELRYRCKKCGQEFEKSGICPKCKIELVPYRKYNIDFYSLLREKTMKLKLKTPSDIKGVIGLTSSIKMPEPFEKGIIRARYGLFVFKDGTIRYDATDAPLTHFKPIEIGVSIQDLRKLGYVRDIYGNELVSDDQILELKVQDIIINDDCAEYLVKTAKFIDELLTNFYGLEPFYNVESRRDLLGHLVVGLAPHTSAGIIGRIIGFTKAKCIFAHPYWHAAKRRNCDGDEDAVMLLLDVLLNFSKAYLPKTRGGMMDAPLVVTSILNPFEVDSEVYNLDTMKDISLEFYRKSHKYPSPDEIEDLIYNIEKKLGKPEQYLGFHYTHSTTRIDNGPVETSYKKLSTMKDKIEKQFNLMSKIVAVDLRDVADRILEIHFFPDIMGNLRAFGSQQFRCVSCNTKFRRPPLSGRCPKCGGNIIQTIHKKSVLKYSQMAKKIIDKYGASNYNIQRYRIFELTDFFIMTGEKEGDKLIKLLDKMEKESVEYDESKYSKGKNIISIEDFFYQ